MLNRNRTEPLSEWSVLGLCVLLAITGTARAWMQDEQPSQDPPPTREESKDEKKKDPPSLDDLLGIDEDQQDDGTIDAANREIDDELQRELTERRIADAFRIAIEKMGLSAELLDEKFDSGLGTQRVQEDIIEKLQQLIDQAKQQSNSQASSSSPQQPQDQQDPGKQQGKSQGSKSGQNQSGGQENQGESEPPAMKTGDLNTILREMRSEWGSLPERVRNMLLQGRREKYSSLYDRLTSEYYRKLAEDNFQ